MQWIRFAVLILPASLLQASLVDVMKIKGISPDLLLVCMIFFCIYANTSDAIITSFVIGFCADIATLGTGMGPHIISFGIFGTALAYLNRVIAMRRMPYQSAAIMIVGFIAAILAHLLSRLKGSSAPPDLYSVTFWRCLYSCLIGPFLFLPIAWWMRTKSRRRKRY